MTTYDSIIIPGVPVPYKLNNLSNIDFEGLPPLRNVVETSPRQAGSRVVDVFYEERHGTLVLHIDKRDKRNIQRLFSPSRTIQFDKPFIYRKETDGGERIYGSDAIVIENTGLVISKTAFFVDKGGIQRGDYVTIDGISVKVNKTFSDSVISVDYTFTYNATNVKWSYISSRTTRELEFYIVGGLNFIRTNSLNTYTIETLDIQAAYPFWKGSLQKIIWYDMYVGANKKYPMMYSSGELYDILTTVTNVSIITTGDIFVKPTIKIMGSMTYFTLTNISQNTTIGYNKELTPIESVVINLEEMTAIKYPNEESVWKYVTGDRTTFGLLPYVSNDLHLNSDSITETSVTSIEWRNLYLGS